MNAWILDPGAANHMTSHKHLLHSITSLSKPYLVTLPNGYKVKVTSTSSLHLRSDITLMNVLLVSFFNSISHPYINSLLSWIALHCLPSLIAIYGALLRRGHWQLIELWADYTTFNLILHYFILLAFPPRLILLLLLLLLFF